MIIHQIPLEDRVKKLEEAVWGLRFAVSVLSVTAAVLIVFAH